MDRMRFGIIGCSNIAQKAFLPAIKKSLVANIAGVASRSPEKARKFASIYKCLAFESYEALLKSPEVDAVYISTPTGTHVHWATLAAQAGKHILCEKSLTTSFGDTEKVIENCLNNKVALFEGFAYQFHPQHARVREIINSGEVGEPVAFNAWFGFPPIDSLHRYDLELGGGALLDAGTYTIHAARNFWGNEPVNIHAVLSREGQGVDIHGSVLLDFGSGKSALLAFGFDNMYKNEYSIWCTKGIISLSRAFSILATFSPTITIRKQNHKEEVELYPFDQFQGEIDAFVTSLDDPQKILTWRKDALAQSKVIEGVRTAAGFSLR